MGENELEGIPRNLIDAAAAFIMLSDPEEEEKLFKIIKEKRFATTPPTNDSPEDIEDFRLKIIAYLVLGIKNTNNFEEFKNSQGLQAYVLNPLFNWQNDSTGNRARLIQEIPGVLWEIYGRESNSESVYEFSTDYLNIQDVDIRDFSNQYWELSNSVELE